MSVEANATLKYSLLHNISKAPDASFMYSKNSQTCLVLVRAGQVKKIQNCVSFVCAEIL